MPFEWKGVFPALTTKFTSDDKLDLTLFEKNLLAQLDAHIDGVIIGGTLGEASVLTINEKERLIKFAKGKIAGKVPVILNIAEGSTGHTNAEQKRFLIFANRSTLEVVACLIKARLRKYLDETTFKDLYEEAETLVKMLQAFIKKLD